MTTPRCSATHTFRADTHALLATAARTTTGIRTTSEAEASRCQPGNTSTALCRTRCPAAMTARIRRSPIAVLPQIPASLRPSTSCNGIFSVKVHHWLGQNQSPPRLDVFTASIFKSYMRRCGSHCQPAAVRHHEVAICIKIDEFCIKIDEFCTNK